MTTTGLILVLYVLPMVISGLIHYFDKATQTLGDFLEAWWIILLPFFNIFFAVAYPISMLLDWLQRIKDLKIKSVIIFFSFFILFSCGKSENSLEVFKIQTDALYEKSIITLDSCEYIQWITHGGYYSITHKGNCKFCRKTNLKQKKK